MGIIQGSVFTVPMRNWNVKTVSFSDFLDECFYSTYEELKHVFFRDHEVVASGFYSTYEELKQ